MNEDMEISKLFIQNLWRREDNITYNSQIHNFTVVELKNEVLQSCDHESN